MTECYAPDHDLLALPKASYKRFVIDTIRRTGSYMLMDMLNSHPDIQCHGELFQSYEHVRSHEILENIWSAPRSTVKAVGFKHLANHPINGDSVAIRDMITSVPDIYVIHLRRKNKIRMAVSLILAERNKQWYVYPENAHKMKKGPFHIDPEQLWETTQRVERSEEENIPLLQTQKHTIEVHYEDLVERRNATFRDITDFLDIPFRAPTVKRLRQHPEPLSVLISNYPEIVEKFRDTKYEQQLQA